MIYKEHSSIAMPCQPLDSRKMRSDIPATSPHDDTSTGTATRRLAHRYGSAAVSAGYAAIPHVVLKHYRALGVTTAEWTYVCALWHYWRADNPPQPTVATLATQLGVDPSTIRRYRQQMEQKGLLCVIVRANRRVYDLAPLIDAAVALEQSARDWPSTPSQAACNIACQGVQRDSTAQADLHANKEDIEKEYQKLDRDSIALQSDDISGPAGLSMQENQLDTSNGWQLDDCACHCMSTAQPTSYLDCRSAATLSPERKIAQNICKLVNHADPDGSCADQRLSPATTDTQPLITHDTSTPSNSPEIMSRDMNLQWVAAVLTERAAMVSSEFGDSFPSSSATRIMQLFQVASCTIDMFTTALDQAAARTRTYTPKIYLCGATGHKNRMPYLLRVLENLVVTQVPCHQPLPSNENTIGFGNVRSYTSHAVDGAHHSSHTAQSASRHTGSTSEEATSVLDATIQEEANPIWQAVLREVREGVTSTAFARWFVPTHVISQDGSNLQVAVPSDQHRICLSERINHHVNYALSRIGYPAIQVAYIVDAPQTIQRCAAIS